MTLGRKEKSGAGDRIRTGDIDLGKVALYQLSYSRSMKLSFSPKNKAGVKRCGEVIDCKPFINLRETHFGVVDYFSSVGQRFPARGRGQGESRRQFFLDKAY